MLSACTSGELQAHDFSRWVVDVLQFQFLAVELRKQNWRDYIRSENPIATALLSKMGYNENERVELKKQFFRMLIRMNVDEAKQRLLIGFFETYVKLTEQEEKQFQNEVKKMGGKEGEQVMELIISYEQKGKIEGAKEKEREMIQKMMEKGMSITQIAHLLDRSEEEVRKVVEMKS